ncbi:MAG TPA: integrase [Actinobacteria bacterium]|nr:integrase [Actinomycetota bacterium]
MSSGNPIVRSAAVRAQQLGEMHGWDESTTRCVLDGLATVLKERSAGEPVAMSEVRSQTHRRVSKPRLAEVLANLGLLIDDTTPAITLWIDRRIAALPPGFAEPVHLWLITLVDGGTRSKPRSASSTYVYFGSVRPFLEHWAAMYDHPRQVTKNDIDIALDPLRGYQRNTAINALRSLFRFAKKQGLIFTNPTIGLTTRLPEPGFIPMTDDDIRTIEQLAAQPSQRLAVALAAEHAARTASIRNLNLDDIDIPNRRITLDGHSQRLGELTSQALKTWLDYRRTRWPRTPNRHVLVNPKTVLGTGPVSAPFVRFCLGRNGFSIDQIRADRILHEALTAGPDPLHLSLVFNIDHSTALRYSAVAEHLLSNELEQRS